MRFIILMVVSFFSLFVAPVYGEGEMTDIGVVPEVQDVQAEQPVSTPSLGLDTDPRISFVESTRITNEEIVSTKSGYIHPFLSIGGYHTDNLFRTENNEESDWVAVITPGVWFSLPASHQRLLQINLLNTAPGGLEVSRFRTESERRFQGYALYRADIREYERFEEENRVDHRGEGFFKISLRGGLSLELVDVYEVNRDPYGTAGTADRQLDKYTANLFNAILAYQVSPKLMLRADYGNYSLSYDDARNAYRDRDDNTYSAYIFYQATPKTSMFVQSEYVNIDYDENINDDNEQMNYYLGVELKATTKTRGLVKVGYGETDYDQGSDNDQDDFLAEAQVNHAFTPKTSIYLKGMQRVLQTDQRGSRSILSKRIQIGYRQRIMAKVGVDASAFYVLNEYDGVTTIGAQTDEREDDEFGGLIAIGYSPVSWGTLSLGYEYRERDSNFDTEDYRANTVFLRMTAAL